MTAPQVDTEFTELVDADIPRVDLVGKAANGATRFLIMKAAQQGDLKHPGGLVPPDMVRDLISKADAQEGAPVTDPALPADDVTKDAPPVEVDDLVPTAPGGTTAESLPGSPDWEQLDGDTAMSTVAVLGRVKAVLGWLADREAQEAATGDLDDAGNAWDLDSMAESIDCIIGALAGFAAGEHLEAGMADELEAVGKSVAGAVDSLAVVEQYAPVVKAGRTLSAANESKIRAAVDSLTGVLNSLPAAPAAEEAVTKETAVPETVDAPVRAETPMFDALVKSAPSLTQFDVVSALADGGRTVDVSKAAGDPQLAVFDAEGKLIGTVDPSKLSPIATSPAAADAKDDEPADDAPAADAAPADPVADQAAAPAADAATIPGTQTVQSPPAEDDTVAKAVDARLEEALAPLAKQVRDLATENEVLKEQVRKMGAEPDNRRSPVLNGGTGVAGAVDRDASQVDDFADLRKAADEAKTDEERTRARSALAYAEIRARFAPR